jgi:hypothetical protein
MRAQIYYNRPVPVEIFTFYQFWTPNTTIETIIKELFIYDWYPHISFDLYFNVCAPQSCQYSYTVQYNRAYILATLIGLFGGLTKGLRLFILCMAWIVNTLVDQRKRKKIEVVPVIQKRVVAPIDSNMNVRQISIIPITSLVS